jgi:Domain of unknown function (DUF4389)
VNEYPVSFAVDYPNRPLNRMTTLFRVFTVIPIAFLLATISGFSTAPYDEAGDQAATVVVGGVGLLFLPVLLMLLFRGKYPRWWFDWNLQLQRFVNRVAAYLFLMDDRYPATDAEQSVHLDYPYPDVERDLNRAMPLFKWLLAVPHYIVLALLYLGVLVALILGWFAVVFTARYPRALFDYVEGVMRWHNRVVGYAVVLVTDRYPPFSLR